MSTQARAEKHSTQHNAMQQTVPAKQKKTAVKVDVPPEQIKYANLLLYCSWAGIGILVLTFILYVTGLVGSYIPPAQVAQYWGLSAHEFLVETGAPSGWGWLGMLKYGDFLNLVGIAFLALLTIVGYLVLLLPAYIRKKDLSYAAIVTVEILVLTLAASGILKVGAH
ncbi:DUF1634 domain-containing protein [Desulfallas sp. Bu1-1]|uniref:DUF1634 domain-containing protein n=1 Tax=Desulfallas sp. Bu1-1 TaxID=2787620 RepID=UPI00189CEE6A|nr:DUF1634 domain-containing protein [Desulfallas sp. Bu1-1]MBF7084569.1 DUF1634 domain-containing protein [Desulfallas sp. Bu1-1]